MALLENTVTGEKQIMNIIHTIGRSTKNNLHLVDSDISKMHGTIFWESDCWYIKDYSRNGTLVNQRVLHQAILELGKDYEIQFGEENETIWKLVSLDPPNSYLVTEYESHKQYIELTEDTCVYPDLENPLVSFYRFDAMSWGMDDGMCTAELKNGQRYDIKNEKWVFVENEPLRDVKGKMTDIKKARLDYDLRVDYTLSSKLIKSSLTPVTSSKKEPLEIIDFLELIAEENGIVTTLEKAHFFGQLAHESVWFRHVDENLNYSSVALRKVFRKYFPTEEIAKAYARQSEKIANKLYASRMGNGEEASGDGWKYRGRGLKQLTGKENYEAYSKDRNVDFVNNPEWVAQPRWAVDSAVWYWNKHNLSKYADLDDIKMITREFNGEYNGLEDRERCVEIFKEILKE